MSAIKLSTPSSGSISLSPADTASNLTITVPAETGTMITTASTFAGTGPAFSAYSNTSQTVTSGTFTKVILGTEDFDTNNNFASSRFTPTVAGYYQFNFRIGSSLFVGEYWSMLYKNGSRTYEGADLISTNQIYGLNGSALLYLNGSTDYIELYFQHNKGTDLTIGGSIQTFMSGFLARVA
jgi:hypothetical protein